MTPPKIRDVMMGTAQQAAVEYWRRQNREHPGLHRKTIADLQRIAEDKAMPTPADQWRAARLHRRVMLNAALIATVVMLLLVLMAK